ncbi:MAG TPA: Fe-Mn family superoxide dismutase [Thiobacillaceae bacterium]|nr:Fe-Mn family superoxide dismutase [Thiobacillaceae bacterium]HNU64462.1 Fe-Mn family superoxide dismutase [Thiobacillaceae bacterium]
MPHEPKPLSCDPGRLSGLSAQLIVSHWENNYGGAVKRLNAIERQLAGLDWATTPVFVINGLKREELIASGSMILHEAYFDSLGGTGGDPRGALKTQIEKDFGDLDAWRAEFMAIGKAQGGGSGWTLLTWSPRRGRLVNAWAADHAHNLAGATTLVALDMYEHSYHLDFGAKAGAYVDAFMGNLSWANAEAIFDQIGI